MPPGDLIRIQHMRDAALEALAFTNAKTREDLDRDRKLVLALVKEMEIIGEAAFKISKETREQLPGVPWNDIVGMRHRLIHAYFEINLEIVWQTIQKDLPGLVSVLNLFLDSEPQHFGGGRSGAE
jgi:uncharacterized protein with HEPN domain